MPIAVACECGHGFKVKDKLQGQQLKCPKCSQPVVVGDAPSNNGANTTSGKPVAKSDLMAFICGCGKRIAAKREWAGKRVKCPGCGETVKIPQGDTAPTPASDRSHMDSFLDEVGMSSAKAAQRCPSCKSEMNAEDVICVKCGFDVERGKKLKTKTYRPSARQLDMEAGAQEQRSKLPMLAAAAVIVVLLIVAAVLVPKLLG